MNWWANQEVRCAPFEILRQKMPSKLYSGCWNLSATSKRTSIKLIRISTFPRRSNTPTMSRNKLIWFKYYFYYYYVTYPRGRNLTFNRLLSGCSTPITSSVDRRKRRTAANCGWSGSIAHRFSGNDRKPPTLPEGCCSHVLRGNYYPSHYSSFN